LKVTDSGWISHCWWDCVCKGCSDFVLAGSLHQQCWCSGVASDCFLPCICRNTESSKESGRKYVCLFLS